LLFVWLWISNSCNKELGYWSTFLQLAKQNLPGPSLFENFHSNLLWFSIRKKLRKKHLLLFLIQSFHCLKFHLKNRHIYFFGLLVQIIFWIHHSFARGTEQDKSIAFSFGFLGDSWNCLRENLEFGHGIKIYLHLRMVHFDSLENENNLAREFLNFDSCFVMEMKTRDTHFLYRKRID